MANWGFNLMILCTLATGIGINMYQVLRLEPEIEWMNIFRTGQLGRSVAEEDPALLKPLIKQFHGVHIDRFKCLRYHCVRYWRALELIWMNLKRFLAT